MHNENDDAYFRKLIKSTSVGLMLRLKLPRVLKFTLAGREFHTLTTLSAKKPVASTVVAMRFKQFVGMSCGLANMTKFKNILEVYCHHAKNNLVTKY